MIEAKERRYPVLSWLLGFGRCPTLGEGVVNTGTAVTTIEEDRRTFQSPEIWRRTHEAGRRVSRFRKFLPGA